MELAALRQGGRSRSGGEKSERTCASDDTP
jgi:hypothetical protein